MKPRVRAAVAGVLLANAVPHLASAMAGRRHLTPLGGRASSGPTNAAWAGCNLVVAGLLLRGLPDADAWGPELWAMEGGALAWAAWMAGSERLWPINAVDPAT